MVPGPRAPRPGSDIRSGGLVRSPRRAKGKGKGKGKGGEGKKRTLNTYDVP